MFVNVKEGSFGICMRRTKFSMTMFPEKDLTLNNQFCIYTSSGEIALVRIKDIYGSPVKEIKIIIATRPPVEGSGS